MLIFSILAGACALYFAVALEISMRFAEENGKTLFVRVIETIALLIPVIACGAVQYWKLAQSGEAGSRHWFAIIGTALGAPFVGCVLMLIVVFALFSKPH
jgi:hypothetical protein